MIMGKGWYTQNVHNVVTVFNIEFNMTDLAFA